MELLEIIKRYILEPNTDFAILVDGEWGSGKTYFLKEVVKPVVERDTPKQNGDKYQFLYVSLYGLNSSDELQKRIFLEVNPALKSKIASGVGMILNKALSSIIGASADKDDQSTLISIFGGIKPHQILVFDDLERLPALMLNEVLGFINAYTEHQRLKVIIVAHEAVIRNKIKEYDRVKEKLIRFTYTYRPKLKDVFPSFIKRYADGDFESYMTEQERVLCGALRVGKHINLRTLRFILDLFYSIFLVTSKHLDPKSEEWRGMLNQFLYFLVVYSIEYKKHGITASQEEGLKQLSERIEAGGGFDLQLFEAGPSDEETPQPDSDEEFIKKFESTYTNHLPGAFRYYSFISHYVHTGDLDESSVEKVCSQYLKEKKQEEEKPEYKALKQFENCLLLEDREFAEVYSTVLQNSNAGIYSLHVYPKIFELMTNCKKQNMAGVTIDAGMVADFKAGMEMAAGHSAYQGMHFWDYGEPDLQLKEIRAYAQQLNKELNQKVDDAAAAVAREFLSQEKFEDLDTHLEIEEGSHVAIFQVRYIDPKEFVDFFIALRNEKKRELIQVIYKAFIKLRNYHDKAKEELSFWQSVSEKFNEELTKYGQSNTIGSLLIRHIKRDIDGFLELLASFETTSN